MVCYIWILNFYYDLMMLLLWMSIILAILESHFIALFLIIVYCAYF